MLISAVMYVFDLPTPMIFSIWFFFLIPVVLYIILDYLIKKRYYNRILETIDNLEEKYLLPNVIDAPSFIEGQILYEILYSSSKSMLEKVNAHEQV
ncbi:MAG: sensor histidine kinase, partial [Oscillospiraceae bacterium]